MSDQYDELLLELLAPLGGVSIRKMFGGKGLFRQGLMFAGVITGALRFKADEATIPEFLAEGSEEWSYTRKDGKITTMGYWSVPERLLDEPEEFCRWAEKAFEVAHRADQAKPPSQRKFNPEY